MLDRVLGSIGEIGAIAPIAIGENDLDMYQILEFAPTGLNNRKI